MRPHALKEAVARGVPRQMRQYSYSVHCVNMCTFVPPNVMRGWRNLRSARLSRCQRNNPHPPLELRCAATAVRAAISRSANSISWSWSGQFAMPAMLTCGSLTCACLCVCVCVCVWEGGGGV
jgi:hypothetical protein